MQKEQGERDPADRKRVLRWLINRLRPATDFEASYARKYERFQLQFTKQTIRTFINQMRTDDPISKVSNYCPTDDLSF
jgi:hypothetical protein